MTSAELKEARGNLGLTQKQFAKLLNVSLKTYQKWESVNNPPGPVDVCVALMGRYKTALSFLKALYT